MGGGLEIASRRWEWWNAGMKSGKENHLLRERVAVLEARLAALEEQIRSSQARSLQTDRTVERTSERTADMLRIAWEVLRTSRPDALQRIKAEDLSQGPAHSPEVGPGTKAGD